MKASFLPCLPVAALMLSSAILAEIPHSLHHAIPAPPVGAQGGELGTSVAVDEGSGLTVAGAPRDDIGSDNSGVVKVFDSATGELLYVLPNPSPAEDDVFGISVAISGTQVVVGALFDDTGASNAGSAYVYDLSSPTPTVPVATLNNPSPMAGDLFGRAVAISGTRVVVGAYSDDTGASDAGSAYVYDLNSGTPTVPVVTLNNPSPAVGDYFGISVAISGARVVVGAYSDDTGASNAGSAYAYDLSSGTPTVPIATLNNPSPAVNDYFGNSVGISGTKVVVGAQYDDTGATESGSAYVYDLSSGTPSVPIGTLNNPSPAGNDSFGVSVAISGSRVVVGAWEDDTGASDAGSAYVYDLSGGTPTVPVATLNNPDPAVGDKFGNSVAISGARVVVGAYWDDTGASSAGSVFGYDLSSGTPTVPVATLNNPSPAAGDNFGWSVAISGTLMVVGAYGEDTGADNAGSAYVYDLSSGTPTVPVATLNNPSPAAYDYFGWSVAISGTRVVVGAIYDDTEAVNAGSAYVYDLSSGTPTVPVATLNNPGPVSGDSFGYSVAISGSRVLVGAPYDDTGASNAGSAYVYEMSSGMPTVPVATLSNPGPATGDSFGYSVAISGARVVVGAFLDDMGATDAGSAYVYDVSSGTPTVPVATLNNPGPAVGDYFGASVAISGTRLVVGAYRDDSGASDVGSAYVYDLSSGTPTVPVTTLNNPAPNAADQFALSVAISGTRVVVGAFYDDTGAFNTGSAYLYDVSGGTPAVPVATLNNPSPAGSDQFGYSVTIDGSRVAVGVPFDDTVAYNKGFAYVFGPENNPPVGGTMTMSPASPVDAGTPLTVDFLSWNDVSLPLSYEFYIDDIITGVQDPADSRVVTSPTTPGSHTLKGRIYDALGNIAEVSRIFTVRTPMESFDAAMLAASLSGPDAALTATPKHDGISNLLKYAFNMNLAGPDTSGLIPGTGNSGLPSFTTTGTGESGVLCVEFVQRAGSGLVYTPKKSSSLDPGSFVPLSDTPTITPIGTDGLWERVTYDESVNLNTIPTCFSVVEVTLP